MENNSNDIFTILDRHKKNLLCDLCRKKIKTWNPFNKAVRCVIRTKENIWTEYYHIKCLEAAGVLRKLKKLKAGRWDKDDEPQTALSVK